MPLPRPSEDEGKNDFMKRCMGNDHVRSKFSTHAQRVAVCMSQFREGYKQEGELKKVWSHEARESALMARRNRGKYGGGPSRRDEYRRGKGPVRDNGTLDKKMLDTDEKKAWGKDYEEKQESLKHAKGWLEETIARDYGNMASNITAGTPSARIRIYRAAKVVARKRKEFSDTLKQGSKWFPELGG